MCGNLLLVTAILSFDSPQTRHVITQTLYIHFFRRHYCKTIAWFVPSNAAWNTNVTIQLGTAWGDLTVNTGRLVPFGATGCDKVSVRPLFIP